MTTKNNRYRKMGAIMLVAWTISMTAAGVVGAEGMAWREKPVVMDIKVDSGDNAATVLGFDVKAGECVKVELYSSAGTGYEWQLLNSDLQLLQVVSRTVESQSNLPGGKMCTTFILTAKEGATGKERVDFSLRRSWEPAEQAAKNIACEIQIR